MSTHESSPAVASFRVGEKGRVNLPAQLRELAKINEGDLLIVSSVSDGEIVIKTPWAIREFVHSGVIDGVDVSMREWRNADIQAGDAARERSIKRPNNPDAGRAVLRELGL